MNPQTQPATRDDVRRFPRWLVRVAIVFSVVVALGVLRTMVGLGTAFVHYRTTPNFDSFVAEHAVPGDVAEAWLPSEELLARDEVWTAGEFETPGSKILMVATDVTIEHGTELLLQTTVEFEVAVDPENWKRRGYRIAVPSVQVRHGMHAIVQVGLDDVERLVKGSMSQSREVVVDVLLIAGEGPNSFRVVKLPEPYGRLPGFDFGDIVLRGLLGLGYPPGELPDEGLMYQARGSFMSSWQKHGNGSSGPMFSASELRTNCEEYSYKIEVAQRDNRDGIDSRTSRRHWARTYTWNDQVW